MKKLQVPIKGMHCRSCEILIEKNLAEIPGIKKTDVSHTKKGATIYYEGSDPDMKKIEASIRDAGYDIGEEGKAKFISTNWSDYKDLFVSLALVFVGYLALKTLGVTNINLTSAATPSALPVVFLVGITAGISTCMALVGGLVLGMSAKYAEKHPEASRLERFRPHLFFHLGRIAGFAALGGILGLAGSALEISSSLNGILIVLVGIVMLFLGLQLIDIFPWLKDASFTLPKGISRFLGIKEQGREYSHRKAIIMGALTFFLPCGFTQSMQVLALGSGSFLSGALIMSLFALGTAPGLLGIAGITSVVKGGFARRFFKFAGIVVILLALFNMNNGLALMGYEIDWGFSSSSSLNVTSEDPNVTIENGVQVVKMTEKADGYYPNRFTIRKDMPVKWVVDAQAINSCASGLVLPKLKIRKFLQAGNNVIEFTPTEIGKLSFSCTMGMYTGYFNVVDTSAGSPASAINAAQAAGNDNATVQTSAPTCGGAGGGGCGCGGARAENTPTVGTVETNPSDSLNTQVINTSYTLSGDIQPNTFTVKAGQPVSFVVDVKESGSGCMSTIMIPGLYSSPQYLKGGDILTMDFTPTKKGVYEITCAMGVPRGTITVE